MYICLYVYFGHAFILYYGYYYAFEWVDWFPHSPIPERLKLMFSDMSKTHNASHREPTRPASQTLHIG